MSLLTEIEELASDSTKSLSDALRKSKILSVRLQHLPFRNWLDHELDGYPDARLLPSYRILHTEPRGDFAGSFGRGVNNAPIPPSLFDDELRDMLTTVYLLEGTSFYEAVVRQSSSESLRISVPHDFLMIYGAKIYEQMVCLDAWKPLPPSAIEGVLGTIRNRLLNFVLEIESEDPRAGEATDGGHQIPADRVSQIFNTTIMPGASNIAIGSSGFSQQSMEVIVPGDFDSLSRYLESLGLDAADLKELRTAIDCDPVVTSQNQWGPRVADWIGRITAKAASGALTVGLNVATTLLTSALSRHYGLS